MRKLLLAAVATAAIASPAAARDGSGYVGVDLGAMLLQDMPLDYDNGEVSYENVITVDTKKGFDVGVVGGYDLGNFRLEGELAYKRANVDEIQIGAPLEPTAEESFLDASGRATATSAMVNGMLDFGDDDGVSGFVGGGIGLTRVKVRASFVGDFPDFPDDSFSFSDSDSAVAWQAIAGLRFALSPNIDLGMKYRFFNSGNLKFGDSDGERLKGKWNSHSLMASLVYNFYTPAAPVEAAPPPPPPPPPPPATQTCPDGSVILATETCPVPPPPPPPPPPAPERG
jgi:OOP family OmpA-OmpF porin